MVGRSEAFLNKRGRLESEMATMSTRCSGRGGCREITLSPRAHSVHLSTLTCALAPTVIMKAVDFGSRHERQNTCHLSITLNHAISISRRQEKKEKEKEEEKEKEKKKKKKKKRK